MLARRHAPALSALTALALLLPAAHGADDRKARRERERAAGLVPFPVKLPKDLVVRLQARALAEGRDVDELTAELLRSTLTPG